jgi:ubiquinone/menaquinone biosynthesis C-methylase UbiE
MEAVWARLPIVASKYGGFTDYLQHGKNALLCDAGNFEEITRAIRTILTDDSLCKVFRAENAIVRERLFVSHVAEKYSELFVKEISGRRDQFREMQRHSSKKFIKHYSNFILPRDNRNHKIKASYILQNLHIKTGDRVLEIGTGTGIHADNFTKAFPEALYTGVDISPDMLETTRARIGNKGTLVLSTGDILDFPDNTFDAVYACSTLHHFKDPFVGISEALRVLKRGGHFVFLEPNRYWVKNFVHALLDRSERGLLKISRNQVDRLLQGLKVNNYTVINFLYTPPIPKAFIPFYNIIDSFQARIPLIKETSIMVGAYGEK